MENLNLIQDHAGILPSIYSTIGKTVTDEMAFGGKFRPKTDIGQSQWLKSDQNNFRRIFKIYIYLLLYRSNIFL